MPESGFETRTFLFSDIEGSTRLQIASGDAYADVLATHRKLIRDAVAAHNGIEHRTAGDGFFFVFRSAREALAAAVDAQRSLRAHSWPQGHEVRVRMGLHAGEVGTSDDDVVGLAINEAARIMDAAHGGQILTSAVVRDLTFGALPDGVTLHNLGAHRLKDFDEPVELLHARHRDLPSEFAPPRTRNIAVNLPIPRTSFIGREREMALVTGLLKTSRLVTLTGVGGSGKTRLALETATSEAATYEDGAFFVDLAPLADPKQVVGAVAGSVNVKGDASADIEALLLTYLARRRVLIILDNCEHLVDAAADVCDLMLERCPGVTVLATSREALQIEGEQAFNVRSLRVDEEDADGIQLFVARARRVRPDFEITDANRGDVLAICERLDGIPLAIELAAGRVDHMSVREIAERLDERFELLVGGRRRRAQRQQTLQAAMDWSWALLTDDERQLLRSLAVFAGPFSLEAAGAVSGMGATLDLLRSLVSKSLVNVDPAPTTRYRLLETVRLYAQDQLVKTDEATARRDAHLAWYLERAETVPFDELTDMRRIKAFIDDHPNYRAALDWAMDRGLGDLAVRLVLATGSLWTATVALNEEGRRLLSMVAEDEQQPSTVRADAYQMLGGACMISGDIQSIRPYVERSLELDPTERLTLVAVYWLLGRYPEAIDLAGRLGAKAFARFVRAWVAGIYVGPEPARARSELETLLGELEPGTFGYDTFFTVTGLALALIAVGEPQGAIDVLGDFREIDLLAEYESWFGSLGRYEEVIEALALADLGRFEAARATATDISRAALRDGYPLLANDCLAAFAYITFREGDLEEAQRLLAPVVRDARLRMSTFGSFVGRILAQVRRALIDSGREPDLPRTRDFALRMRDLFEGADSDDRSEEIVRMLEELVGA